MKRLKTGDFIVEHTKFKAFRPATWLALLVRLFTWHRYNHGGIIVIEGDGRTGGDVTYVIHAEKRVVKERFSGFNDSTRKTIQVWRLKKVTVDTIRVRMEANALVGTPYDFWSLIFFQPVQIITGIWLGRKGRKAAEKLYCSELYAEIFRGVFPMWYRMSVADILRTGKLKQVM